MNTTPTKTATLLADTIHIKFSYDPDMVSKARSLSGRKWNSLTKEWTAPVYLETVEKLIEWGFQLDEALAKWYDLTKKQINNTAIEIPGLKGQLRPFQKQAVSFIESQQGRALIADQMGLGKTIEALAWIQLHPELRPVVIVCPASVKLNWAKETKKWLSNPKIQVISGRKNGYSLTGNIIIINYDIVPSWVNAIKTLIPRIIILDEAHYIKNSKAKRTRAIKQICKGVSHILTLTGTPIVNRPIEMFNAINLVAPKIFPSLWKYAHRYCNARHNGFGWDFNGASNTQELHEKLTKTVMIRRLKKDVLKELPEKQRTVVPIPIKNKTEYQKAERDFLKWLKEIDPEKAASAKDAEALVKIETLKQLTIKGKLESCVNWIKDFLENDEKLVVFCTHTETINRLMDEFKNIAVKLDGSVTGNARQQAVEQFQNSNNIKLFVGNIKAAGIGITLTAASNTCFIELGWSPGEHEQAEDRVHRIGQEADSVNAWYLIAEDTIEEKIAKLIDHKQKVLDSVLDGKDTEERSLLTELLSSYKGGEQ